jgi:hypothetical protein
MIWLAVTEDIPTLLETLELSIREEKPLISNGNANWSILIQAIREADSERDKD